MNKKIFVKQRMGKRIGDGQCVALIRDYITNVLLIKDKIELVSSAKEFWDGSSYERPFQELFFRRIPKTEKGKKGDIVVFGSSNSNKHGHVGIFLKENSLKKTVILFDQDGIRDNYARIREYDRNKIIGFLRKRSLIGMIYRRFCGLIIFC